MFIAVALHYKVQSSFCLCMLLCTLVWWFYSSEYPKALTSIPEVRNLSPDGFVGISFMILSIDLFLLYVIFLNGLLASLSHLGHFERVDGTSLTHSLTPYSFTNPNPIDKSLINSFTYSLRYYSSGTMVIHYHWNSNGHKR